MMKRRLPLILLVPVLLWGCESDPQDPGGGGNGGPVGTKDSIEFSVYTIEPGKVDRLRWQGNAEGAFEDSPEQTERPWVGFGKPFRVDWAFESKGARIVGYRYRATEVPGGPFLPPDLGGEMQWAETTSFSYANDTSGELLEGEVCDTGTDCPDRRRLDSGQHRIQVIALDDEGGQTDVGDGTLEFEINYPPESSIPVDEPAGCDDDTKFPRYVFTPEDGSGDILCNFAEGDTIPSGSIVTIRMAGNDRLGPEGEELCCDQRLDLAESEVTFQGRLEYTTVQDRGSIDMWSVGFAPTTDVDLLQFRVGPFDYTFFGRTKDEHGRPDPNQPAFSFVAGFVPRITGVSPADGTSVLLRDPDGGAPWPENELEYEVMPSVTWYWATNQERWFDFEPVGAENQQVGGTLFRIPMAFAGVPDPREPRPQGEDLQLIAGSIRSWAYAVYSEGDPENNIAQGGGFDDIFRYADAPELNGWDLTGADAIEIFIPDTFWTQPGFYSTLR